MGIVIELIISILSQLINKLCFSIFKCNFVALNHQTYRYRSQFFARLWAFLLLAVFLNATLIESLHHHAEKVSYGKQKSGFSDQQLSSTKLKCKLCEVVKHRSHFFDLPSPAFPGLPIDQPVAKSFIYQLKHTSAYLLLCTNKGPPGLKA